MVRLVRSQMTGNEHLGRCGERGGGVYPCLITETVIFICVLTKFPLWRYAHKKRCSDRDTLYSTKEEHRFIRSSARDGLRLCRINHVSQPSDVWPTFASLSLCPRPPEEDSSKRSAGATLSQLDGGVHVLASWRKTAHAQSTKNSTPSWRKSTKNLSACPLRTEVCKSRLLGIS